MGGRALNARCQKLQTLILTFVAIVWTVSRMIIFTVLVWQPYKAGSWYVPIIVMTIILTLLWLMQWVWGILCWHMVIMQYRDGQFDDIINDEIKKKPTNEKKTISETEEESTKEEDKLIETKDLKKDQKGKGKSQNW